MTVDPSTGRDPFKGLLVGVYRSAPDGTLLYANTALVQMLGFPDLETLLRQPVEASYPLAADRMRWLEIIEREGVTEEFENLNVRYDGSQIWIRDSSRAVRDASGKTLYYEGVLQDITERKRAEDDLSRERTYFTQLFDNAPEGIAMLDSGEHVVRVNTEFTRMFGYTSEESLGRLLNDLVVPPELMAEGMKYAGAIAGGERLAFESIRMSKDGRRIPVSVLGRSFQAPGHKTGFYAIYRDITEMIRARDALEKTRTRFQSLIENASDMVSVFDLAANRTYVSPSTVRSLGYSEEELLGKSGFDVIHPDDLPAAMEMFGALAKHPGETGWLEFRVRRKDGEWRVVSAVGKNLLDDPAVAGIVLNSRDITEQRNLSEQLRMSQRMEAVGRLAGGVAHDFNNLLTVISTFTDFILADAGVNPAHREDLGEIRKAADRAASLTRQLLAFGRGQVLRPRILDINAEVRSAMQMLERVLGENIEIAMEEEASLWRVNADHGQIQQVLLNLALNARDAMPHGGMLTFHTANRTVAATGRTAAEYVMAPGDYVVLAVSDNGVGMDIATQRRVFEPFFSTKGHGLGTGLGLSTVYGIVKQSGGYIEVQSAPGEGSTFEIFLPRVEGEADANDSPETLPRSGNQATVLLAEDEQPVREAVKRILAGEGHRVIAATNGREALEYFTAHAQEIDVLVTDIVMPEMGGAELAKECVSQRPLLGVLYMSGYADAAVITTDAVANRTRFIGKPFNREAFLARLAELLPERG